MDWTTLTKQQKDKARRDAQLRVSLGVRDHDRRRTVLTQLAEIVVPDKLMSPYLRGENKTRLARMLQLLADAAEKDMPAVAETLRSVITRAS